MPESAAYRKNTEQVVKHRMSIVEQVKKIFFLLRYCLRTDT